MGRNDHLNDNELGNLPPEAFSTWDVDGPFEPQDHWLKTAKKDDQIIASGSGSWLDIATLFTTRRTTAKKEVSSLLIAVPTIQLTYCRIASLVW